MDHRDTVHEGVEDIDVVVDHDVDPEMEAFRNLLSLRPHEMNVIARDLVAVEGREQLNDVHLIVIPTFRAGHEAEPVSAFEQQHVEQLLSALHPFDLVVVTGEQSRHVRVGRDQQYTQDVESDHVHVVLFRFLKILLPSRSPPLRISAPTLSPMRNKVNPQRSSSSHKYKSPTTMAGPLLVFYRFTSQRKHPSHRALTESHPAIHHDAFPPQHLTQPILLESS